METPAWATALEKESRNFTVRDECHRALQLKVFGKCAESTPQANHPQHPWVAEFYEQRKAEKVIDASQLFKSRQTSFQAAVIDSFMLARTQKRFNSRSYVTVCCSGKYDLLPSEFKDYEKRGYLRRL